MANATLLELVNQAQGEMGLSISSTVIGNTVADVVQQRYLINAVGNEICREKDWTGLQKEYRFSAVYYTYTGDLADGSVNVTNMSSTTGLTSTPTYFSVTGSGVPQDAYISSISGTTVILNLAADASGTSVSLTFSQTKYGFPSDFDHLIDRTDWDKTKHWEMMGPETPQQRQWLKSGFISTGPRIRFWPQESLFQIWPPAGIDDTLGYEYVSKNWIFATGAAATSKSTYTVDTDTCIFPDRLMVLGLKHKYFQVKGFGDIYRDEYLNELSRAKAMEGGSQTLSMAPRLSEVLITQQNIPDSGYGS